MKYLHLVFFVSMIPLLSFGQNEYFSTDSSSVVGVNIVDGGDLKNSEFCQIQKGNETIKYTPYEISEYGFKDGRVYVSKEISLANSSRRVFLERLIDGKTTLYYYKGKDIKTFFIQKDSTLFIEVPKHNQANEDYTSQLLNLTNDCADVLDASKLARYNKKSFSKLIARYNQCILKPFPHFRYGALVGYETSRLIPSTEQNNKLLCFNYKYEGSFAFGVFIDQPIFSSDLSLHPEFFISKHIFSLYESVNNMDMDLVINLTSLNMPLLLRYAYPSNKIRPFFDVGINGVYYIKNKSNLYETTIKQYTIVINDTGITSMISNIQAGYIIGSGIEYKLNYKNSLLFEIRYCKQYNIDDNEFIGTSAFSLFTGINF